MSIASSRKAAFGLIAAKPALIAVLIAFGAVAVPGDAVARGGPTTASLATPLAQPRQQIVDGVLWKCSEDRCSAPTIDSRPALVCARLAKAFGVVARFSTAAGELSADELTRCNAAK